jgi:hypothetical protein
MQKPFHRGPTSLTDSNTVLVDSERRQWSATGDTQEDFIHTVLSKAPTANAKKKVKKKKNKKKNKKKKKKKKKKNNASGLVNKYIYFVRKGVFKINAIRR